jgi:hypothetical protein
MTRSNPPSRTVLAMAAFDDFSSGAVSSTSILPSRESARSSSGQRRFASKSHDEGLRTTNTRFTFPPKTNHRARMDVPAVDHSGGSRFCAGAGI